MPRHQLQGGSSAVHRRRHQAVCLGLLVLPHPLPLALVEELLRPHHPHPRRKINQEVVEEDNWGGSNVRPKVQTISPTFGNYFCSILDCRRVIIFCKRISSLLVLFSSSAGSILLDLLVFESNLFRYDFRRHAWDRGSGDCSYRLHESASIGR